MESLQAKSGLNRTYLSPDSMTNLRGVDDGKMADVVEGLLLRRFLADLVQSGFPDKIWSHGCHAFRWSAGGASCELARPFMAGWTVDDGVCRQSGVVLAHQAA